MKKTTLWFIVKDWKIMLAMKKRGFWAWLYNGVGGKVESWETIEEWMIREANEEIWIRVKELEKVGVLKFYFDWKEDWNQSVYVFFIKDYDGEILESEEMKPYWFNLKEIPYSKMWEDDEIWLPGVLDWERNIDYDFYFDINWKLRKWKKLND